MRSLTKKGRFTMRQKSRRVIRFVVIQCIALIGSIAVQSFFSLFPVAQTLPFILVIFIEAVWWSGLLLLMLLLFLLEYNRFVQAAVDLEEANRRLRLETNGLFQQMREKSRASRGQDDSVVHPQEESMAMKEQDEYGEHLREEA